MLLPSDNIPIYVEPEKEDYVDISKGLVSIQQMSDETRPKLTIELSLDKYDMDSLREICIRIFNGKAIVVLNDDSQRTGISTLSIGGVGIIKP